MPGKTLTARESIEAAFDGKTKLKANEIIAHVEANKKSAITKGTIRTQLQVQSSKGAWIKRVAPGTYSLVKEKAAPAKASKTEEIVAEEQEAHDAAEAPEVEAEVAPDPKPSGRRARARQRAGAAA